MFKAGRRRSKLALIELQVCRFLSRWAPPSLKTKRTSPNLDTSTMMFSSSEISGRISNKKAVVHHSTAFLTRDVELFPIFYLFILFFTL